MRRDGFYIYLRLLAKKSGVLLTFILLCPFIFFAYIENRSKIIGTLFVIFTIASPVLPLIILIPSSEFIASFFGHQHQIQSSIVSIAAVLLCIAYFLPCVCGIVYIFNIVNGESNNTLNELYSIARRVVNGALITLRELKK